MLNTSILTAVLASALLAGQNAAPNWQSNYSQAAQQGAQQKKPLAVVFGSGANGWEKISRDGSPASEAKQLLASKYICVYVDTTTPAGQKLAKDFDITGGVGMVLSDRTGAVQAFWHQGDLANQSLVQYLQKYSDSQRVVSTTETATTTRLSFYPSDANGTVINGTSGVPADYCPSCNNYRGRR